MNGQIAVAPVVRHAGEGEKLWFAGGGIWTWKTSGADPGEGLSVVEIEMNAGKVTPMHTHPVAESLWVLEGQLRYRIDTDDVELDTGDFVMVPRDVPHAFMVLSDVARVLALQPSDACEAFYRGASEPLEGSARVTDFGRIARSGELNGGITIVGPPPF
ncbi:cupin domain-containing protein [Nocardioides sp. NPDC087217]|uniref:cupin domain-containing protein n=1 Tax=Nocardioides sp. NPDC087217 TaxID=3364335 RepID=UPI0037FC82E3